jgi:DNA-binding CsgD family transcriptional regulator
MSPLHSFAQRLARALNCLGTPRFPDAICSAVGELVAAEDISLILFRVGQLPTVEFNTPRESGDTSSLESYLRRAFLLDPYYRAATVEHQYGVFRLKALAPHGFKSSEYYRTWYRNNGLSDECGLLIPVEGGSMNLSLGMTSGGQIFSERSLKLLRELYPIIEAAIQRHWSEAASPRGEDSSLQRRMEASLHAFGSSVLTRREQQITGMVLLGNSTRLIAEKLAISTETVKLHRKHAYAKLDISSQAELFSLFMQALTHSEGEEGVDPLIALHSPTAAS